MPCIDAIDEARRWLFQSALPFWASVSVDGAHGGFHEALDLRGRPLPGGFRRLRVTCRQIYTFAHAYTLGFAPGLEAARAGFAWLVARGWQGPSAGWARRLTPEGRVLDGTAELYDHAFVLFACGWWHRASGDPEALVWAHRTLDFVEARLRHPRIGFLDASAGTGWRSQNPHMHLLEAALVLYETSAHPRFAELACELATLFSTRFFDPRTGTLGEAFTDALSRAPGEIGRVVEPGHHFEWAWILAWHQRALGEPTAEAARALVAFAESAGVDPVTGVTFNAVRDDGAPVDRGSRTWPNTERLKGHIALFELDGTDPSRALDQTTSLLLERYLAHRPAGTWMDHFDGVGRRVATTIPSATLYHLVLAFSELLRVAPSLGAGAASRDVRPATRAAPPPKLRAGG